MPEKQPSESRKRLLWALIVLTLCVIWGHSLMPGDASMEESNSLEDFLRQFLGADFVFLIPLRKLGHMAEFAVLCAEFTLLALTEKAPRPALAALSRTGFAGFLDETLQYVRPDRSPEIRDVWIDVAGAVLGMLFILLLRVLFKRKR